MSVGNISMNHQSGYLKLVIGCMMSGKSSFLMSEVSRYKCITPNILVINHAFDKERHNGNFIQTHDKKNLPALMLHTLSEIHTNKDLTDLYAMSEIVVIDEGQFYSDLYEFVNYEVNNNNKMIIVGGLSGDFNMSPIGDIIKLVPVADEIIKLKAFCIYCKDSTSASFTRKEIIDHNQISIGGKGVYSPVCRKHFNSK